MVVLLDCSRPFLCLQQLQSFTAWLVLLNTFCRAHLSSKRNILLLHFTSGLGFVCSSSHQSTTNDVNLLLVSGQIRRTSFLHQVGWSLRYNPNFTLLDTNGILHSRHWSVACLLELSKCHYRQTKRRVHWNLRWHRTGPGIVHFSSLHLYHIWIHGCFTWATSSSLSQHNAFADELFRHYSTRKNCKQVLQGLIHRR